MTKLNYTAEERADLHLHSHCSDGVHSPEHLAIIAANRGLRVVALTDHEEVKGVTELTLSAAPFDVYVVPGVELNSSEGDFLGYFVDYQDRDFLSFLRHMRKVRSERSKTIVDRLRGLGLLLDWDELVSFSRPSVPARPHIARLLVHKGLTPDVDRAFKDLLGKGGAAYKPASAPSAEDCIEAIQRAGGLVVEAHPHFHHAAHNTDLEKHYRKLARLGVVGYEVSSTTAEAGGLISRIQPIARKYGLLELGGSDFHGLPVSATEMGAQTIGCDQLKSLTGFLPGSCVHKSLFKRMEWRSQNLTGEEFAKSLQPEEVVLRHLQFRELLNRPPPAQTKPKDFRAWPFVLIKASALDKETLIAETLAETGAEIVSFASCENYHEIAWDLYEMQRGNDRERLADILKFNLDRHLYGDRSTMCKIIFYTPDVEQSPRDLKKVIRRRLGNIRFYRVVYEDLRETCLTAFIHIPEEDNVDLECWRLHQCGVTVPVTS